MKVKASQKIEVKTLHQLAKLLIKLGKELEKYPNINFSKFMFEQRKTRRGVKIRKRMIEEIAMRLKETENLKEIEDIERKLNDLNLNELKYLCKKLGFSFEKRRKFEIIDYILNATVKSRVRHKLLRNFGDFKKNE